MASESKRRDRQVVRVIGILDALLHGTGDSVHDFARRFGTRRETIYRDLRTLEDAGYAVVGDNEGHLSRPHLLEGRRTPQVRFTPEELTALDWAAAQASAGPFSEALDGARQKLQVMRAAQGQEPVGLAEVTDSWGPTAPATAPEVLLRLAEGILRRRACMVTYRTPDSPEAKTYSYHPYRLLNLAGAFYCVGKVPPRNSLTTLATHRIGAIELLADSFTVDQTLDLNQHRQEAFGVVVQARRRQPDTFSRNYASDRGGRFRGLPRRWRTVGAVARRPFR